MRKDVQTLLYVGQNWNWLPDVETFVMDVEREDAPDFLAANEAGVVGGKFGLKEHVIGFAVNGLATPGGGEDPFRKLTHVRSHEIFDAERFDAAIEPVIATGGRGRVTTSSGTTRGNSSTSRPRPRS